MFEKLSKFSRMFNEKANN